MLTALHLLQLVVYIALLALLGQGALHLLAGAQREQNFFYRLLRLVGQPFTRPVRRLTPSKVADRHVPVVTFLLLTIVYAVVTIEKIKLCLSIGLEVCR